MPEPGPAFYLGAEDDEEEIHIRLAAIAKHYGVTFKDLNRGAACTFFPCSGRMRRCAPLPRAARSR